MRHTDAYGNQIVTVQYTRNPQPSNREYTYAWNGAKPLKVGDTVWVPATWVSRSPQVATVTGLGSTYTGAVAYIQSRAQVDN